MGIDKVDLKTRLREAKKQIDAAASAAEEAGYILGGADEQAEDDIVRAYASLRKISFRLRNLLQAEEWKGRLK